MQRALLRQDSDAGMARSRLVRVPSTVATDMRTTNLTDTRMLGWQLAGLRFPNRGAGYLPVWEGSMTNGSESHNGHNSTDKFPRKRSIGLRIGVVAFGLILAFAVIRGMLLY
jgi:hypothetical protein